MSEQAALGLNAFGDAGLNISTSHRDKTDSTPVMVIETYLPCSSHSKVSVAPSSRAFGIQLHNGLSLGVVEFPTLISAFFTGTPSQQRVVILT